MIMVKDRLRVTIVERNQLLRKSISASLSDHRISVTSFANLSEAISAWGDLRPHVVLLDALQDSVEQLEFLKSLKKEKSIPRVVVINSRLTQMQVMEYVRMGVSGFVLGEATPVEYLETIRTVASGLNVLPPPLTGTLFEQIMRSGKSARLLPGNSTGLTKRESEIVDLIADGLNNKDIASRLDISECTVKNHVHSVLEKLNIHSRLEIARFVHIQLSR